MVQEMQLQAVRVLGRVFLLSLVELAVSPSQMLTAQMELSVAVLVLELP
jgi:hypothetical protein